MSITANLKPLPESVKFKIGLAKARRSANPFPQFGFMVWRLAMVNGFSLRNLLVFKGISASIVVRIPGPQLERRDVVRH
jgi:hypothetical protein